MILDAIRTYQMHTYQIEPPFTTARGTVVDEWPDLELSWHAYAHYKRQYYETSKARDARQRAEDPDNDEKNRRSEATFLELHPEWAKIPVIEFSLASRRNGSTNRPSTACASSRRACR